MNRTRLWIFFAAFVLPVLAYATSMDKLNLNPSAFTFSALGTPTPGEARYCSNCSKTNPCTSGGSGATALGEGTAWNCGVSSSTPLPTATPAPTATPQPTATPLQFFGSSPGSKVTTTGLSADPSTDNCVKWIAGGKLGDAGAACGTGSGSGSFAPYDEATPLPTRSAFNCVGPLITCSDDAGNSRTNITITNPTPVPTATPQPTPTPSGGGSTPNRAYFQNLAAWLEPLAIEPMQVNSFSYSINSSTTKYLAASYYTRVGSGGRLENRFPYQPIPLRNVTLAGLGSGAAAIIIDPSLPTYLDAEATYYSRLNTLDTSATQYVGLTAQNTAYPLLPGAYGAIITGVSSYNFTWVAAMISGNNNGGTPIGVNLQNEIGDTGSTDYFRIGHALRLPISKYVVNQVLSGPSGGSGSALGGVSYVLLPSSWGAVTDSTSYIFRDDFMGASLNTGSTWTRAQSTTGNVEIKTQYQWLGLVGDSTAWGNNGLHSQSSTSRANGKVFLVDVFIPSGADGSSSSTTPNLMVGWSDGAGQSYTNFSHGLDFTNASSVLRLTVFENGTSRGNVGANPGFSAGSTYRVRITLGSSNNATYEIQGLPEYSAIGSASWTDITPGTTSSSTTPLYAGATIFTNFQTYISDMRLY